jgi:DNA processing protein
MRLEQLNGCGGEVRFRQNLICARSQSLEHVTPYGQRIARSLAEECARAGLAVVSGLAMGVDSAAHLGALDAPKGRTLAIVASGVDAVHPASNRALADRIREAGAIVSAYAPGTPPHRGRFLDRNELVAALCQVVVVVEGIHPSSGALSTANRAHILGREVLAVPGSVTTPQASAPNRLIRDGLHPCLDVTDILVAMDRFNPHTRNEPLKRQDPLPISMMPVASDAKLILELVEHRSMDAAAIASATGFAGAELAGRLLELELAGFLKRDAMGAYTRA